MKTSGWHKLVREPFVHFLVLGALVFGIDQMMEARKDDPRLITVGPEVATEIRTMFKNAMGREPSAADMKILQQRWVDNEVLYREGLALRVDQGDSDIRERVIFKALSLMQANLALPRIDEQGLRAWFAKHRDNYDEPARYDFLEAVLLGDKSDATVKTFVAALNSGVQSNVQSDAHSGLRVFKARPRPSLVSAYGDEFTRSLESLPLNTWAALRSKDGVHVVRLEAKVGGKQVDFDTVRTKVQNDWKESTLQELSQSAVRKMGNKYKVKYGDSA